MPTLFPRKLWQLVREHDLVLLVKNSSYMDTWTLAISGYALTAPLSLPGMPLAHRTQ